MESIMVLLTDALRKRQAKAQRGLCFYCHLRLHDDRTWEHLVARHHGGNNKLSNLRVSHGRCNSAVGVLPVALKWALSEIGEIYGSDAFFLLVEKLKREANFYDRAIPVVRRPKKPSPRIHKENLDKLISWLPEDILEYRIAA